MILFPFGQGHVEIPTVLLAKNCFQHRLGASFLTTFRFFRLRPLYSEQSPEADPQCVRTAATQLSNQIRASKVGTGAPERPDQVCFLIIDRVRR